MGKGNIANWGQLGCDSDQNVHWYWQDRASSSKYQEMRFVTTGGCRKFVPSVKAIPQNIASCLEGQVFPSHPDPTRPLPLPPFLAWFENCVNFLAQKFGRLKVWQKSFPNTTSSSFLLLARALKDRSNICLAHASCHNMGYCNVANLPVQNGPGRAFRWAILSPTPAFGSKLPA